MNTAFSRQEIIMRTSRKYTLGFIGLGHMGLAIARGAVIKEYLERWRICVYDPSPEVREKCKTDGFDVLSSEREVAEESHLTLLAVTPQMCDSVLEKLKGARMECLVSIVTGVSIKHLQETLDNVPVIRVMPNTPLQISEGSTAMCKSANCRADEYDFVFQLFNSMGVTRTVPEEMINVTVSVHGSIPAYVYYFTQCILDDVTARGLDERTARALLVQTIIGAGKLMQQDINRPLDDFIDEVCSKGGTTIEAIQALKDGNLPELIKEANDRCIHRAEELGE